MTKLSFPAKLLLATGTGLTAFALYETLCPQATLFGRIVNHGKRNRAAVSLVFDKAPHENTRQIASILRRAGAPATFFLEGRRTRSNTRAVMPLLGFELGIHGEDYSPLLLKNRTELRKRILPTLHLTNDLQGHRTRFLMPPMGFKGIGLLNTADELGLVVINPSVSFKIPSAMDSAARHKVSVLLRRIRPGDIVLCRAEGATPDDIAEYLPGILDGIKEKGLSVWGLRALLT
ncbi:MAG: polysaccharide deacetylase family protein [Dissulfuribacterales bacterium]